MADQSKADRARAELAVAEAEEKLVEAKQARKTCGECGRVRPGTAKQEKAIARAKAELRAVRQAHREARSG